MLGPGKYDDLATYAREKAEAEGVIVLVFGGNKGGGFAVQLPAYLLAELPNFLRNLADSVEGDSERFAKSTGLN